MIHSHHLHCLLRFIVTVLPVAFLLTLPPRNVSAQEFGDAAAGRQLAVTWCSNCHVVELTQQTGTSNGAPTFSAIGAMTSTTQMGLRAFLQTPHDRMPDLHLSRNEIDDVSAYIVSFRQAPR